MITSVDTVMVGKVAPASYTNVAALADGAVALFDQNRALITTAANAVNAASLYIGVKHNGVIEYSNEIQKNSKPEMVYGSYTAPVNAVATITLTSATITAGNRYVIRILYKDIEAAQLQFTHTYEVIATSSTAADLVSAFANKINAHSNRRVNASASAAVLTLTAMDKDDNEGMNSINEYSIVDMQVSLYETNPAKFISNIPAAVSGAVIAVTVGNPGKGLWKQIRDAENRQAGAKQYLSRGAYPEMFTTHYVVEGQTYDYITIGCDNEYLSCDNQYIKNTPIAIELYVNAGQLAPEAGDSIVKKGIEAFITGEVA